MNLQQKFMMAASAVALTAVANTASAADDAAAEKEKCYGVAKAGSNSCHAADDSHTCAGLAKTDSDKNEWVYLPKGTCDLLAGGTTVAPAAAAPAATPAPEGKADETESKNEG